MDYRITGILISLVISSIIFVIGSKERIDSSVSDSNIEYLNQKKFAITRCLYKVLEFDIESIGTEGSSGMYVQMGDDPIESFEKIDEYITDLYESDEFYYNSKPGSSLILGRCIDLIDDEEFGKFLDEINN